MTVILAYSSSIPSLLQIAQNLQQTMYALEDYIPLEDLNKYNLTLCRNLDMYPTTSLN